MWDRRRHRRVSDENRIKVTLVPKDKLGWCGPVTCLYRTDDISRDGLSFHSFDEVPVNAFLRIEVKLKSSGEVVALGGVVRWAAREKGTDQHRVGVEILDHPAGAKKAWCAYVDERVSASVSTPAP